MSGPLDPYQPYPRELPPTPPYPTSATPYDIGAPSAYEVHPPAPAYPQNLPAPYSPPAYQPVPAYRPVPMAYPVDPLTGQPFSDKSKITAGLLQLLPAILFGLGGIGRLYAGNIALGVVQLVVTVLGWICFWCGFVLIVPLFGYAAAWVWFVVDGIVMLAGRPLDGQGRPLRA